MSDDLVKILEGNTFVVSDERGDIEASLTDPTGLFSFDTRFLSKWVLTVNGQVYSSAYLILPELTMYNDVLEIIAAENLRQKLCLQDGDVVRVEEFQNE